MDFIYFGTPGNPQPECGGGSSMGTATPTCVHLIFPTGACVRTLEFIKKKKKKKHRVRVFVDDRYLGGCH